MDSIHIFNIINTYSGVYVCIDYAYLYYTDYKYKKPKFVYQLLSEKTLAVLERIETSINRKVKLKELKTVRNYKQFERVAIKANEKIAEFDARVEKMLQTSNLQMLEGYKRALNSEAEVQRHIDSISYNLTSEEYAEAKKHFEAVK